MGIVHEDPTIRKIILFLFCFVCIAAYLFIPSVSAGDPYGATADNTTGVISALHVTSYAASSNPGYVISQIQVSGLPVGANQTHILNSGGRVWYLTINSTQSYLMVNAFNVSLTYPDGSSDIQTVTSYGPTTGYDTLIQPTIFFTTSTPPVGFIRVVLEVGLNPLNVTFQDPYMIDAWNQMNVPFTDVSGTTTYPADIYISQLTADDFRNHVQNGVDYVWEAGKGAANLGGWAWEAFKAAMSAIPVVGPGFLSMLDIFGILIVEIGYWFAFIIGNSWRLIAGGECFIIMGAALNAIKGKNINPELFFSNVIDYNFRAIRGFWWMFSELWFALIHVLRMIGEWLHIV